MSFHLLREIDSYEWTVSIRRPHKGTFLTNNIKMNFHYRSDEELEQLKASVKDLTGSESDKRLTDFILKDWPEDSGLNSFENDPLVFSEEAKAMIIDLDYVRKAVIVAFYDMREGMLSKN